MSILSHASVQGMRAEQQDRWICEPIALPGFEGQLLAVADGHGGSAAAELVATELLPIFEKALQLPKTTPEQAIREAFKQLDRATQDELSGTTLSLVFIAANQQDAYLGVLGDSPVAILNSQGEAVINSLHNVRSNTKERHAAVSRGGDYVRGYIQDREHPAQGLQLSRCLGDRAMKRILNRQPDIHRVVLNESSVILLATDGVLDSFDEDPDVQIRRLLHLARNGQDAEALVQDALNRQTGDNVTVVLWQGKAVTARIFRR